MVPAYLHSRISSTLVDLESGEFFTVERYQLLVPKQKYHTLVLTLSSRWMTNPSLEELISVERPMRLAPLIAMDNNQPPRILPPLPQSERHAGPPPTKRQKVAIACDVCRAKKVKVCGFCNDFFLFL